MRIKQILLTVIFVCLSSAGSTFGQEVSVNADPVLISIPVAVRDKHGDNIPNLKKDDFTLFRDGKPFEFDFFKDTDEPVKIALLLDVSPSTAEVFFQIKGAALDFIQKLKTNDEVSVVPFDSNVRESSPLTGNRIILERAIRSTEPGLDEGSVMRDAVSRTLRSSFGRLDGKKAIIILTDGIDVGSKISKDELMFDLEESDTVVYTVYYETQLGNFGNARRQQSSQPLGTTNASRPFPAGGSTSGGTSVGGRNAGNARKYLEEISISTGGTYQSSKTDDLPSTLAGILEDLRSGYRLGFFLSETAKPGDVHKLRVEAARDKSIVLSRAGYRVR